MRVLKKKRRQEEKSIDSPVKAKLLGKKLDENVAIIKNELGNSSDLSINISVLDANGLHYAVLYIDNLIDNSSINSLSIELSEMFKAKDASKAPKDSFSILSNFLSGFRETEEGYEFDALIQDILSGNTIFLLDGYDKFLSIDTFMPKGRDIAEPTTQNVIRGPREAFTEKISVNISLVRKRIKNKALRVENLSAGTMTNTQIMLMYIDKVAKKEIVDEIKRRLDRIKIDGILDSGHIEELIKDDRYSIFPEFLSSEKPDSVAAALLEGRVAIFTDGTAYVLTAPAMFIEFLQASEDYYHQYMVSSVIRIIRYLALLLTLFVPAGYVSLVKFHQEMIPAPLLISIAAQREGVPFPALFEAILMEVIFEILREAGIRLPRVIGPAISIVGALVLGQATVEAGIVSAVMVIIVSITAISSFAIPNYSMANAIRIIRFAFMFLAGIFGLFGVFMGLIALILHLCKLKTIGIPYMAPIAPKTKYAMKDSILRYPIWISKSRPPGVSAAQSPRVDEDNPVTPKQKESQEFR
ncbi:MAG: spore germination protein [Thermoclostridium sp.]|nr:spore germination protein [Thermoclostridium sp.]